MSRPLFGTATAEDAGIRASEEVKRDCQEVASGKTTFNASAIATKGNQDKGTVSANMFAGLRTAGPQDNGDGQSLL